MQKVIKIIGAFCAVVTLLALSVFSVSANSAVDLVTVSDFVAYTDTGASTRPTFTLSTTETSFRILTSTPGVTWWGYRITLNYPAYMRVDSGYYFQFSITTRQNSASPNPNFTPTTSVSITTSDGVSYDLGVVSEYQQSSSSVCYVAVAGGYVGNGQPVHISDVVITSDCPVSTVSSGIPSYYDISVFPSFSVVPTPEQERHEELMENINQSTDKITGSIEDSTDEITNGWATNDDTANETDGAVNGLGDAENDALGGKTDEQIQGEIDNALGGYEFPDQKPDNIIKVGMMFDDLLDCFGAQYESLLILALTLGLGAFLVGRQFKTKE